VASGGMVMTWCFGLLERTSLIRMTTPRVDRVGRLGSP
jgi:hypothetical protein